ncbi:hypothetical protein V5O48_006169 [Marasmius crinis-equi]|uniref:Uncharacterized protein n=1 Tax=Marasmius crinis-equi TaxID=585013 RepID=A0ABR3FL64_9AGAR
MTLSSWIGCKRTTEVPLYDVLPGQQPIQPSLFRSSFVASGIITNGLWAPPGARAQAMSARHFNAPDITSLHDSGPLADARQEWLAMLTCGNDGEEGPRRARKWNNPPGYPVPTKSIEEIVTITPEDGKAWEDWVCVSPVWPDTYVSPVATVGSWGDVTIDDEVNWNMRQDQPFLHIHRICLSFLCRRNNLTPHELWETLFTPGSPYEKHDDRIRTQGLLHSAVYYHMEGRNYQDFSYAVERWGPPPGRADLAGSEEYWVDPESMEDAKWILARPTVLPAPKPLGPSPVELPASVDRKVFDIPELFDAILDHIVDLSTELIEEELRARMSEGTGAGEEADQTSYTEEEQNDGTVVEEAVHSEDEDNVNEAEDEDREPNIFEAPSAIATAKALLSLAQADRWFYHAIVRDRQGLFIEAKRNFGWMLPCTPADWAHTTWPRELTRTPHLDWRGYMVACLRKEDPHIRNRWRFNMMAVQIARGVDRSRFRESWGRVWYGSWHAGKLGLRPELETPVTLDWELPLCQDEEQCTAATSRE